jgi:hypothetical protein
VQGVTGSTGPIGPTQVGPTGPAGVAGATGAQGAVGYTGAQGSTDLVGVVGPAGRTGANGPQGEIGQTGAQGPGGPMMAAWTPYREFWFDSDSANLTSNDAAKAAEVASYLTQNPGQKVGIDGSGDMNNPALRDRRVGSVRNALLQAGVPSYKIQVGPFGDPQMERARRVAVLVSSS